MFVFYCVVSNNLYYIGYVYSLLSVTIGTVGYVYSFRGDQTFVDFVSFLSMIIDEVLYT